MKILPIASLHSVSVRRSGFSLIEVVLAIGIFLVTVLALVGLLGPTLQSVDEVEKNDEIASVVNTVNAFLQNSPDIAPNGSKFDSIYNAVADQNFATIFVFRKYTTAASSDVELEVGFVSGEVGVDSTSTVANTDFSNAAGPIYRVVLTPSSVLPAPAGDEEKYRSAVRSTSTGTYTLNASLADYEEGYFAMEVRIFAEDPPGPSGNFNATTDLEALKDVEPIFTYNTAVVR